jgi:FkbM family methyltransferase
VKVRADWTTKCHPAAKEHFEVFRTDPVQSTELDAFISHCPKGIQLLDVGAHYGFFAVAALHYGGKDARVVCIEASPGAFKILRSTLELNDSAAQVKSLNVAMGGEDGMLPMLTTGPIAGDYFIVPTEERSDTILVPQRTLSSVLQETDFNPTHIKIDIEGFEFEVIESGLAVLRKLRPVLFLELHGTALKARGKSPEQVIRMLRDAGYTRFSLGDTDLTPSLMIEQGYNCRMICS